MTFLNSIVRGVGPETKKVIVGIDAMKELKRLDSVYYEGPTNVKMFIFGKLIEFDPEEIAIRFE